MVHRKLPPAILVCQKQGSASLGLDSSHVVLPANAAVGIGQADEGGHTQEPLLLAELCAFMVQSEVCSY